MAGIKRKDGVVCTAPSAVLTSGRALEVETEEWAARPALFSKQTDGRRQQFAIFGKRWGGVSHYVIILKIKKLQCLCLDKVPLLPGLFVSANPTNKAVLGESCFNLLQNSCST